MIPSMSQQPDHNSPESSVCLLSNVPTTSLIASNETCRPDSTRHDQQKQRNLTHFTTPITAIASLSKPPPYKAGLTPAVSPLRPHCLARDRLKLWCPAESQSIRNANGNILAITDDDLQRVLTVMNSSLAQGTRESYGAGLLVFYIFCDTRSIPEHQRCPVDTLTMLTFIASCAGAYAGKTLANYVFSIQAWHILLINHFTINNPSPDNHLFAWRHQSGMRPLTRGAFLKRIRDITRHGGCPGLKGHSI